MEIKIVNEKKDNFNSKTAILRLVDGTSIKGSINTKQNTRLSDHLNTCEESFVVMFNCCLREDVGKVIFVNKSQIVYVIPVDD
ncbi:MAG: hypothetical protein ACLFPB_05970 [Desulfovermiculus sp.]